MYLWFVFLCMLNVQFVPWLINFYNQFIICFFYLPVIPQWFTNQNAFEMLLIILHVGHLASPNWADFDNSHGWKNILLSSAAREVLLTAVSYFHCYLIDIHGKKWIGHFVELKAMFFCIWCRISGNFHDFLNLMKVFLYWSNLRLCVFFASENFINFLLCC